MKTIILSKRFSTIIVFLLAIISAVLLFTIAPKQVTKADEEENEDLATYTFTLINNDTEYSVGCSNKSVCTKAEIPSEYNGLPVTSIGGDAFYFCTGLTSITIPDSVTNIGACAFLSCSSLTSITIPDSVTSIEACAFNCCSGLTSVIIGNSVTSIGNSAFNGCTGLTNITIPDSVTSIGDWVFYNCSSLTSITIYASNPPVLQEEVFSENLTAIYVPAESVDSYIGAEGWSEYETLIQPIPVQENNNETPANTVNSAKTGSDVAGNSTGVMVLSTVILLVSAVAIVAVIKRFGLRRH